MQYIKYLLPLFIFFSISSLGLAQNKEPIENNILLIIDYSHNMKKSWSGKPKSKVLREELKTAFGKISKTADWGLNVGIRLVGDSSDYEKMDCNDSRLAGKVEWFDPITLNAVLEGARPKGRSCIANGLRSIANDFPRHFRSSYGFVIIIMADNDECTKDLPAAANEVKNINGWVDAVHVIGLHLNEKTQKDCAKVAKLTQSQFINVKSPSELADAIVTMVNLYSRPQYAEKIKKEEQSKATNPPQK